jgi:tetratricopeptide (TPR) repeat protein
MSHLVESCAAGATIEVEAEGAGATGEAPELWQERPGRCLECGKESLGGPAGRCPGCGSLLLRRAIRRGAEPADDQDAGLARSQDKAMRSHDIRRALCVAATRLRLAQSSRPSAVPGLLLEMASLFGALGEPARREKYVERALGLFREAGSGGGVAMALAALARMEQERGRLDQALARCHEALREVSAYGDRDLQGRVELSMGQLLEATGLHAQALHVYRRLTAAEAEPRVRFGAILGVGRTLQALGDYPVAFGCFENASGLAHRERLAEARPQLGLAQASLLLTVRDTKLAGDCLDWAEARLSDSEVTQRIELLTLRGRHNLLLGHSALAEQTLQQAADLAGQHHAGAQQGWARYHLAQARRAQSHVEEARSAARAALERAREQDLRELFVAAAVLLAQLDPDLLHSAEGEELVRQAHTQAKELLLPELLWRTSQVMASLCEEQGNLDMERRYLGQARGLLEEMRQKYEAFRRASLFFSDPEKLRLYQHWAQRMLDWDLRGQVEQAVEDCAEPALARTLQAVLFPASASA